MAADSRDVGMREVIRRPTNSLPDRLDYVAQARILGVRQGDCPYVIEYQDIKLRNQLADNQWVVFNLVRGSLGK